MSRLDASEGTEVQGDISSPNKIRDLVAVLALTAILSGVSIFVNSKIEEMRDEAIKGEKDKIYDQIVGIQGQVEALEAETRDLLALADSLVIITGVK